MAQKLGEINRPQVKEFSNVRKLFCLPIIPQLKEKDLTNELKNLIEQFWNQTTIQIKDLERTIGKDFEKLLREQTYGSAFFHILKNSDRGTLPLLLKKYKISYKNTLNNIDDTLNKWFIFFIFVKEKQECYFQIFDDITEISDECFKLDNFSRKKVL